jgi:AraC-like DNA-binding protein
MYQRRWRIGRIATFCHHAARISCNLRSVKMSDWEEYSQALPDGGTISSRGRRGRLPGGLWWLDQHVRCRGAQIGPFAMGPGWIVEFIEMKRGRFDFRVDGQRIAVPWRRFVFILPAFSVVHMDARDAEFHFVAVAGDERPDGTPDAASRTIGSRVFPLEGALPRDAGEALKRLATLRDGVLVEISAGFPALVRRAKRWIEQHYHEHVSIAALARTLGISHPHLSREFRRAAGMSPLKYLHHLRSTEAMGKLAAGESITDASLDVGYGDLSRFYKQFRRLGCSAPGQYRGRPPGTSKSAKTRSRAPA